MRPFRTVLFDCDSTLSTIEGIEELAAANRPEIVALTEAAMRGEVPLETVYAKRLELVQPTRDQVTSLGQRYVETLVPDAREVCAALRTAGIQLRVISGGLRPAVLAVAQALGIPDTAVEAVDVRFHANGRYAGFDVTSPLARSGGKFELIARWLAWLPARVMLVGDGATDLEAAPLVDLFVAFAGVVDRPSVAAGADIVIRSRSLAPILPLALGGEPPGDPTARAIFQKGMTLLDPQYQTFSITRHFRSIDAAPGA